MYRRRLAPPGPAPNLSQVRGRRHELAQVLGQVVEVLAQPDRVARRRRAVGRAVAVECGRDQRGDRLPVGPP